jgi:hypothetical protein
LIFIFSLINTQNYKKINNYNIPSRKLNLKRHNINSIIENYRNNNINKNEYNTNKIESNSISKYLLYSRINRNKILKKENILNIDSITKSKINSFKNSMINDKYQSLIPNQKKLKSLKQVKNSIIRKHIQPESIKDKNNFFNQYASASVYIQRKNEEKKKNDLKEYRLGLLSAGSTSYNNVIIPMLSLTRQPSNFFNDSENEKSFGNDETTKNKKNYMTYRKKNIISGNLKQNQKRRNMSSYSKKANEEEFKDVEKLIPKFHKIKIEKGMMDSKLTKTLRDNFMSNYYNNKKYQIRNRSGFLKLINNKGKIKNIFNEKNID